MSNAAKKSSSSENLKDQVAAELELLAGLQGDQKEELKEEELDAPAAPMKSEDLEYPDLPASPPPPPVTAQDDDMVIDESQIEEIGSLSAKQRFDLSQLEKIKVDDADVGLDDLDELEEDPTSGGFELNVDELVNQTTTPTTGASDAGEGANDDGEQSSNRQEQLRLKRKKQLEEKKRQRMEEERKQQEQREREKEFEKQNNILSVEELKRQAQGETLDDSDAPVRSA